MTCEVVVSNKNGLALAADSAVTLGPQEKVYHSAEKLFRLSETEPVAIMTYGSAQIMGVPWETVVKIYRRRLATRRFDYVEQYADDFLRFLDSANPLFAPDMQSHAFRAVVRNYLSVVARPVWDRFGSNTPDWSPEAWDVLLERFLEDHHEWERYDSLTVCPGLGQAVLARHAADLDECLRWLFDDVAPPQELRNAVLHTVEMMHEKQWISPYHSSGVVIAGFGDLEVFPRVQHMHVGAIAAGRLRYVRLEPVAIDHETDACVTPLAQRQMIDMFYDGIHPILRGLISDALENVLDCDGGAASERSDDDKDALRSRFWETVHSGSREQYSSPLLATVAALPLKELAALAETLVSLTAFRARMSAAESETVGGDIDVAVISKGDGFVWVRQKALVGQARTLGGGIAP